MEYIITLKNTSYAMKAEKILLDAGEDIAVIPLPSEISAGCGLSLQLHPASLLNVLDLLYHNKIDDTEVYSKLIDGDSVRYEKLKPNNF